MTKIIRNTKTLTRITKKGGKVVRRYRKVTTTTRRVKSPAASSPAADPIVAAPSQNLDD